MWVGEVWFWWFARWLWWPVGGGVRVDIMGELCLVVAGGSQVGGGEAGFGDFGRFEGFVGILVKNGVF